MLCYSLTLQLIGEVITAIDNVCSMVTCLFMFMTLQISMSLAGIPCSWGVTDRFCTRTVLLQKK